MTEGRMNSGSDTLKSRLGTRGATNRSGALLFFPDKDSDRGMKQVGNETTREILV
jgi:hypothetical protein